LLRDFISKWRKEMGPARGSGFKRGGFKFGQYKQLMESKVGVVKKVPKIMLTKKQFTDLMVSKGKDLEWALQEYNRRRTSDEYERGVCHDTGLPTLEARGITSSTEFTEKTKADVVELGTSILKNPKKRDVQQLLDGLGEEAKPEAVLKSLHASAFDAACSDLGSEITFGAKNFVENLQQGIDPQSASSVETVAAAIQALIC
jgi:hypothetical protein